MKFVITKRHVLLLIVLFSLIGIAISVYDLVYPWGEEESFCDISSKFSCTIVNTCKYARLLGIPIAAIGIAGYSALFAGAAFQLILGSNAWVRRLMALAASGAVIFSLYLTGVEAFVLHVYCPTCLASQASIAAILISCWFLYSGKERRDLLKLAGTVSGQVTVWCFVIGTFLLIHTAYAICPDDSDGSPPLEGLDKFAQCLAESGAVMYGSENCGACDYQIEMFGTSWQYMISFDCAAPEDVEVCRESKILYTPTWQFGDGTTSVGVTSFAILSAKTGCTLAE